MIICLDVGNTNIKYALFEGDSLVLSFRVATEHKKTSDEYGGQLISILKNNGVSPAAIRGGIISSVVPPLDFTLERMCDTYLKIKPLIVASGLKTGMNLKVDNAKEVGADRVVNNVAAVKKYGAPAIVIDFGTATTFNVIDEKCQFRGGVIAPARRLANNSRLVSVSSTSPRETASSVTSVSMGVIVGGKVSAASISGGASRPIMSKMRLVT